MNVLGKIKSKRVQITNKEEKIQVQKLSMNEQQIEKQKNEKKKQKQQKVQSQTQFVDCIKFENFEQKKEQEIFPQLKQKRSISNSYQIQYLQNTNVMATQKQKKIRQKTTNLTNTSASVTSVFHTKKQHKRNGIYFNQNPSMRHQNSLFNFNNSSKNKFSNQTLASNYQQSEETDQDFTLNFDFLLSNKEKRNVKKSLHLTKGKHQNIKHIQQQLISEKDQVLLFIVKKWHYIGDIFMFEGELESLKKRYIQIDIQPRKYKAYDRLKIKVSCSKDILNSPETIGRIYFSQMIFISQNQAVITHQSLLKIVQKSLRYKKR